VTDKPTNGGVYPEQERQQLTEQLNQLTQVTLPELANGNPMFPVRFDHCFKRIVFDNAVGSRWDKHIQRPFYRHAPLEVLYQAVRIAEGIAEELLCVQTLNNRSLEYRDKLPNPLVSRAAHC
jgi:hypothetical protein